jgi:hypothetical protein
VEIIEQVREGLNLTALEKQLNDAVFRYANAIAGLGMEAPLYVFLSFLSVRGFQLYNPNPLWTEGAPVLGEDSILLPEAVIEEKEFEPRRIMQPLFDMVWNAFGLRGPARPASGPRPPTAASRP